jgi:hypothetical protein
MQLFDVGSGGVAFPSERLEQVAGDADGAQVIVVPAPVGSNIPKAVM